MPKMTRSIPVETEVTPPSDEILAWSIPDYAKAAGDVHRDTVYEAIKSGDLRAVKWGRRTLILYDDGKAHLDTLPEMGAATT